MPKSYRIRTEIGKDKFLQVKLDQDYDKLELLSLAIFPNDVYIRNCADFGVVCGRVFSNKGFGMPNAKVSIFIPLQEEDFDNPVISTLYPYRSFEQFNEDGYKYNLLPYTQSHSGHVPVGTFPERIDALTNPSVVQVYDKYYKFTAKTNDAGDFMIFGVPVGQHDLFMQVDLSDIGEFSLTPQDLLRSGRATEAQLDGTRFKFSENYSELPQIVTLTKRIQVAPFYGQKEVCDYYITRADFDLTLEALVSITPTAVFMGALYSAQDKRKIRKNCKVPVKQGWLCDMIAGPGSIETIRQTVNIDAYGNPILENFLLDKDGKLIDENGAWLIELPMNLEYVYTDELGNRQISPDGSQGIPTKGKYRFKIKWNQSTFLNDENKRGYFLVPNIKEWGWSNSAEDPVENTTTTILYTFAANSNEQELSIDTSLFYVFESLTNLESYSISFSYDNGNTWVEKPEYKTVIPSPNLSPPPTNIRINYTLSDPNQQGSIKFISYDMAAYQVLSSYAFSVSWDEYGTSQMIQEAINCEDRFYNFEYNKVYTVSQFLDRYTSKGINLFLPQRTVQIKHITDNKCDGIYNQFPTNDSYYRYDVFFIIISAILTFLKFILIPLLIVVHALAFLWKPIALIITLILLVYKIVVLICKGINKLANLIGFTISCPESPEIGLSIFNNNPFKNIKLPLILSTEDGCQTCKCNIESIDIDDNQLTQQLNNAVNQLSLTNISNLADLSSSSAYDIYNGGSIDSIDQGPTNLRNFVVGSTTSSNQQRNRLPFYNRPSEDGFKTDIWSSQLPLAERLNLFNTKAKFFDRDDDGLFGEFSPGNIGWNQIKTRFAVDIPQNDGKWHYDNVIVLILDNSTGLTQGDLITFQKPTSSTDPNKNETNGKYFKPLTIDVKYAKPKFGDRVGTTTYEMYSNQNELGELVEPRAEPPIAKKTCYPTDIEYFQVIKVENFEEYKSKRASLNISGDNRFSLPWRFLDSSERGYSGYLQYGDQTLTSASHTYNNSYMLQRHVSIDGREDFSYCVQNVNFPIENQTEANYSFYFNLWKNLTGASEYAVCFLVRGVDPHSGRVKVKYDLSRLYGYEDYLQQGLQVEDDFYMNIPIQASNSDENIYGLALTEHTFCGANAVESNVETCPNATQNTIPLFYKSYFFEYSLFADPDGYDQYNFNWTTINHKYYSALGRKFVYDGTSHPGGNLSCDGASSPYSPQKPPSGIINYGVTDYNSNPSLTEKTITINAAQNYMSVSWFRRRETNENVMSGQEIQPCCTGEKNNCRNGRLDQINYGQAVNNWYGCTATFRCKTGDDSDAFYGAPSPYVWYDGFDGQTGPCTRRLIDGIYHSYSLVFHAYISNNKVGHVGGYWGNEYVEGGSAMNMYINGSYGWDYLNGEGDYRNARVDYEGASSSALLYDGGSVVYNQSIFPYGWGIPYAYCPSNKKFDLNGGGASRSNYMTPCYYTIPANSEQFSNDEGFNEIQMASPLGTVFRSDRLPTSDRPNNGDIISWGYMLHQNPGFRIFRYIQDCTFVGFGGGTSAVQQQSVDPDNTLYTNPVIESLSDCTKAVDLNSYYIDNNSNPAIQNQPQFSKLEKWKWFARGEGCYNTVSRPIISLFPKTVLGNGIDKTYSDIRTIVEWVQRTKLTLAACFDIFSHTFSNNWVNGSLYAFPFQLTTRFDENNLPIKPRSYCKDLIYFNDTINNFFYRSSPYDGYEFIGKTRFDGGEGTYGNAKNLLYPTTVMDLGPKNPYVQELVFSNNYDGYIADRIPSTTYQDNSTLLNMFILSRMVNSKFLQLLIPINNDDGNNEGGDDPSIGAFFGNKRWANGQLFADGFLPGLIDADYAQMISINCEIGTLEYTPNNYVSSDTFVGTNAGPDNEYPYFGVVFSGDNQWRDYISPRRKVYDLNGPLPLTPNTQEVFIPGVNSQEVPFYQWNNVFSDSNSIFGFQNNNYTYNDTTYFKQYYQQLDRLNPTSEYFLNNPNLQKAQKGYIANYTNIGTTLAPTKATPIPNQNPATFGAPFHFYFGLIKGSTAMDLFITKYVDTTKVNE